MTLEFYPVILFLKFQCIRGIVVIQATIPIFYLQGDETMEVNLIIELILTAGIGIITFFLKRTIDELDECKKDIVRIKEDYITKEDFFREQTENRRKLDRIMDILLEIKGGNHNG